MINKCKPHDSQSGWYVTMRELISVTNINLSHYTAGLLQNIKNSESAMTWLGARQNCIVTMRQCAISCAPLSIEVSCYMSSIFTQHYLSNCPLMLVGLDLVGYLRMTMTTIKTVTETVPLHSLFALCYHSSFNQQSLLTYSQWICWHFISKLNYFGARWCVNFW